MQKGYKRNNKGIAVVRFFCGLIFVAIIVFAVYCLLNKFDWSDSMKDPSVTARPYVEMTASPIATGTPEPEPTETPVPLTMVDISTPDESEAPAEMPEATATAIPTPKPTATPKATEEPTPAPTPIVTPTPVPTEIPAEVVSEYLTSGFSVPAAANDAKRAITKLYISEPNNSQMVQIDAYAYIDEESYDAANTTAFLIVTHKASGAQVAYRTMRMEGISKTDHSAARCKNPAASEFESFLDVSWYGNGEFDLGVVLAYADANGNNIFSYHQFDECFTVTDGRATYGAPVEEMFAGDEGEDAQYSPDLVAGEEAEGESEEEEPVDDGNSVG